MDIDNITEIGFDLVLMRELKSRIKLTSPPSAHIQAWRDFERQKFGILGRNPRPSNMGYNLWTDATGYLHEAFRALTDAGFRKFIGFTPRTTPRRALCRISEAVGYRYLRGLELIEHSLKGEDLQRFRRERAQFRHQFEKMADDAHADNDRGQNPAAALAVVRLFADELLALCPWLELVGQSTDAVELRREAVLPDAQ